MSENLANQWPNTQVFSLKFTISILYLEAIHQRFLPQIIQTAEFINIILRTLKT